MAKVKYYRGNEADLPNTKEDGAIYIATDTGAMYTDYENANEELARVRVAGTGGGSGGMPNAEVDGNWVYRLNGDGTFDAWYKATSQSITITAQSGNLYRSELRSLAVPNAISGLGTVDVVHASVNASHNNYPAWGMLASVNGGTVNYYAMSGGSRSNSPNYIVTAHIFGTIS